MRQPTRTWVDDLADTIRAAIQSRPQDVPGWEVIDLGGERDAVRIVCGDGHRIDLDRDTPAESRDLIMAGLRKHRFATIERAAGRNGSRPAVMAEAALLRAAGVPPTPPEPTLDTVLRWYPEPQRWDITITPAIAEAFMQFNSRNRPPSDTEVRRHVTALETGLALYTHQGVAFYWDQDAMQPVLGDGQTRLAAIIRSGVAWKMQVTVCLAPEVFPVIDTGRRRTLAQLWRGSDIAYPSIVSAMSRMVYLYDRPDLDPRDTRHPISPLELDWMVRGDGSTHPGDLERFEAASGWGKRFQSRRGNAPGANPNAAATAVYLLWRECGRLPDGEVLKDPRESPAHMAYDFLTRVLWGEQMARTDAPMMLRSWISMAHQGGAIVKAPIELGVWIKAWNAYVTGETKPYQYYALHDTATYPKIAAPTQARGRR